MEQEIRICRQWAVISMLAFALWFALGLVDYPDDKQLVKLLSFNGYGALIPFSDPYIAGLNIVVRLGSTLGLLLGRLWGGVLFYFWTIANVVSGMFGGLAVTLPIDSTIGFISSLLDGALMIFIWQAYRQKK